MQLCPPVCPIYLELDGWKRSISVSRTHWNFVLFNGNAYYAGLAGIAAQFIPGFWETGYLAGDIFNVCMQSSGAGGRFK